jgi:hypothetical protein
MGSPAIFSGNAVKLLKPILDLFGQSQIASGTIDPSAVGFSAPVGSLYLSSNGNTYQKQDAGFSTNWLPFASSNSAIDGGTSDSAYTTVQQIACGTAATPTKIFQFRQGTAAVWTAANTILARGEPAYETDSGLYKIGDGSTAWVSLAYGGLKGPAQTSIVKFYGDGSDGNVNISSGSTVLARDMYYNNLTLSGSGTLTTNGYKVFVAGILDITAAAVGAIRNNGNPGNNASTSTGGAIATAQTAQTLGAPGTGTAGGTGTTTTGANGTAGPTLVIANGGNGGAGAIGGTGLNGAQAAGTGGAIGVITNILPIRHWEVEFLRGITLIQGGNGGSGAGAGGGDTVNKGGGGGGGANGGGIIAIYAKTINRGASTPANCIQANGGNGGVGAADAGNAGGGGGGAGGGGGYVYLVYTSLTGTTASNAIQVTGGNGGAAGNGLGTGAGGTGGAGGAGGRVYLLSLPSSTGIESFGSAGANGTGPTGGTGGTGGAGNNLQVSL